MKKLIGSALAGLMITSSGCGDDGDAEMPERDAGAGTVARDAAARDAGAVMPARDAAVADAGSSSVKVPEVVDCTSAEQKNCIAASGVHNDKGFSCTGGIEDVARFLIGKPSWVINCDDVENALSVHLEFPVQEPGAIDLSASAGSEGDLSFYVSASNLAAARTVGSMTESSTNLTAGKLLGTVESDNTLLGTLTASWGLPSADCKSGDSSAPCRQGSVKMTFHVQAP